MENTGSRRRNYHCPFITIASSTVMTFRVRICKWIEILGRYSLAIDLGVSTRLDTSQSFTRRFTVSYVMGTPYWCFVSHLVIHHKTTSNIYAHHLTFYFFLSFTCLSLSLSFVLCLFLSWTAISEVIHQTRAALGDINFNEKRRTMSTQLKHGYRIFNGTNFNRNFWLPA